MSEDNYTPQSPLVADLEKMFVEGLHAGVASGKFLRAQERFIDCDYYCEHRFHMADDRLKFLPADWKQILDRCNAGTDVPTIRRGPLFRILAFRWLNPETAPGIQSLN